MFEQRFTPEQQLRFKEIELATERKLNHCCDVKFAGKERELALMEQLNRERSSCCQKVIQSKLCCCKGGSDVSF